MHSYSDDEGLGWCDRGVFSIDGSALEEGDLVFQQPDTVLASATLAGATSAAYEEDRRGTSTVGTGFKSYGVTWLRDVMIAFFVALICNGIWGVPLYQVVDVTLALSLTSTAVVAALLAMILVYEVFNGLLRGALESLVYLAALAFLPFAAITGYMIYGWLGGGDVTTASFVYKIFVGLFVKGYTVVAGVFGDVFGAITQKQTETGVVSAVDVPLLLQWTMAVSAAIAALDKIAKWILVANQSAR